ncbi:MAG: response regulator transcription factor [Ignavibacteriales bacterium]|nr:response regulator transcription factor [Ignavibacteriales bacterium]
MSTNNIKIAIVEDNAGIRESMALLINGSPGFSCLEVYGSAEEAVKELPHKQIDVVLMDINLPHMNGIDCTRIIKEKMPDVQIIMQTVYENTEMIFESLKAGASGYLLKRTPPVKVLEAIEDVFKGGSPMSSQIARMVVESFHQKLEVPEGNLTTREEEILTLLSKGFKYREIAESLFISMDTVRTHIRHIYEKLHVRSRTEAVIKFLKR